MMKRPLPVLGALSLFLPACDTPPISSCFLAGTRVWTPDGPKAIESLVPGDTVWSWNTDTHQPVLRTVLERIVGEAHETTRLQAGEQVITGVTDEHPIWIPTAQAWLHAGTLRQGQEVLCWLGQHEARALPLQAPQRTRHETPVPVYTLSLDGPEHNFFAEGFLAHNKSPPPIRCFAFEFVQPEMALSIDFGEVTVGEEGNAMTELTVLWQQGCESMLPEERQLQIALDDPDGGFRMETMTIELLEESNEQLLELPIAFVPSAVRDYEAQVVFDYPEARHELAVEPERVQLFGTGQAAE